jgi:hypothetical protein
MAALNFLIYDGSDFSLNLAGSGLGFYGEGGFSTSCEVGSYQGCNFVTDSAGLALGAEVNNVKYLHPASGLVNTSTLNLLQIPNFQSTLNIRFTHDTEVNTSNAVMYLYDRSSINNDPSGVTCKVCEIIHPSVAQDLTGSGDHTWYTPHGSSVTVPFSDSPGISGLFSASGTGSTALSTQHDFYTCLSVSPDSVGSKQFALYFGLEYS